MPLAVTPAPPATPTAEAVCKAELPKVVETWIGAWNRKDFATYIGTYDAAFVPAKA